jgi:hypothetical protein
LQIHKKSAVLDALSQPRLLHLTRYKVAQQATDSLKNLQMATFVLRIISILGSWRPKA